MGVVSASGTMKSASATGTSGLIFGVDFSSGKTSAFLLSNTGLVGEGRTRTACEDVENADAGVTEKTWKT